MLISPLTFFLSQATAVVGDTVTVDWLAQLQTGGVTIAIQGVLVVALVAVTLERLLALRRRRFVPAGLADRSLRRAVAGDYEAIRKDCRENPSVLSRGTEFLLDNWEGPSDVVTRGAEENAQREVDAEFEKLATFSLIASAAPLLGLLGTMIGMIEAFQLVALYGDEGGASMLADSIAKALITTAVGLVIALPALFIHHFFKRRIQQFSKALERDLARLERAWITSRAPSEQRVPTPTTN